MFCHRCGKYLEDDSAFCLYCGTKIPQNYSQENLVQSNNPNLGKSKNKNKSTPSLFQKLKSHHIKINFRIRTSTILYLIAISLVLFLVASVMKCDEANNDTPNFSQNLTFTSSQENTSPASYENNTERWDAENCIYSNFEYGIAFTLPKSIAWHLVAGTTKHTIVKFVQPDTQLTIFVNMNPFGDSSNVTDIWDIYEDYTNIIKLSLNKTQHNTAEKIEDYDFKKAEFCGKHAIKSHYTSVYGDDRYNKKERLTTLKYTFIYNKATTIVTIKCYDDMIDVFKEQGVTLDDFLKGFQLIPIC